MFDTSAFHTSVPQRPMGKYAHIILLRETDSYSLFQTDGELNRARVQPGRNIGGSDMPITRITMFKRKQTTPERLVGRELLRRYGFISGEIGEPATDGPPVCDYNVKFCMQCPDCITYGFAIGDAGSEKSKLYSDTAYSLTPFDTSHETFTLNAPYESGTMSRQGNVTSRINEQDHVRPQTLFPAVITMRDPTEALFKYVLNNIMRTRRYGAQTTRTGTMTNHVLAVVFADGEIFSNLLFTQSLYDALQAEKAIHDVDPVNVRKALEVAQQVIPALLSTEHVRQQVVIGTDLQRTLDEFRQETQSENGMQQLLEAAWGNSKSYYETYIKKAPKTTKAKSR